jgi:hypothetical protein
MFIHARHVLHCAAMQKMNTCLEQQRGAIQKQVTWEASQE